MSPAQDRRYSVPNDCEQAEESGRQNTLLKAQVGCSCSEISHVVTSEHKGKKMKSTKTRFMGATELKKDLIWSSDES